MRFSNGLVLSIVVFASYWGCGSGKQKAEPLVDAETKSHVAPPQAQLSSPPVPPPVTKPLPPLEPDKGSHAGRVLWAKGFGNTGRDNGRAVSVDSQDRIAVGGIFSDEVSFGGKQKLKATGIDGYVAVFSQDGAHQWAFRVGGSGDDVVSAVAFDAKGNLYFAGWFSGSMVVGGTTVVSVGADDVFVAKLTPTGDLAWLRSFGGLDVDAADALAVTKSGDVIVTGVFRQTMKLGDTLLTSAGRADIFVARLDGAGKFIWSVRMGGIGLDYARDLAILGRDIIFLGEFSGTLRFASGPIRSRGDRDVLLCRFDPNGKHVWAKGFGGLFPELAYGLAIDPAGHIVLSGSYYDEISFGGPNHKSAGEADIFLARFTYNGTYQWSKSYGSSRMDAGLGVGTDGFGNIVATGFFQEKVDFGQGKLSSAGNKDMYLMKLSPLGKTLWTQRYGGSDHDQGRALSIDSKGRTIVTGTFRFDVDFGKVTLRSVRKPTDRAPMGDVFLTQMGR